MQIQKLLERATLSTCEYKEHLVSKGPEVICPIIEVWRGEVPIALVTLRHHDRDEILAAATGAAVGFDADALAVSYEGWAGVGTAFRSPNVNPLTGDPWAPGEMEDLVANHGAIEKNWIQEIMIVTVVNRAGDLASSFRSFHYTPERALVWGKARDMSTMNEEWKTLGMMPNILRRAMLAPSGATVFPYGDTTVDRTHRDAKTAQLMSTDTCAVALYANADDAERIDVISKIGTIIE